MTEQGSDAGTRDEYVPHSEAMRIIGNDKNALQYRARTKKIRTIEDEQQGTLYNREDVIAARDELVQKKSRKGKLPKVQLGWVETLDDLFATLKLDQLVYNEIPIGDLNLYFSWIKRNPRIARAAFDAKDRGKVYAYVSLLPLPEDVILDILLGHRDELSIKPEEIELPDSEGDYTLLAESAVALKDHSELLANILKDVAKLWAKEYPRRRIRRIYAQGATGEGKIMLQKLFFGPLYVLDGRNLKRIKDAYVIDMDDPSASKFIKGFQEEIGLKP